MAGIDFTNLDATLGAYCRGEGRILYNQMLLGFKSAQYIDVNPNVKDEEPLVTPFIGDIVQVGKDDAYNPTTGAIGMKATILKVRPWQVDLKIVPIVEYRKWTGKLFQNSLKPYEYPFERFILEKVLERVRETAERIVWQSVYAGGTAATAGNVNPLEVCDGFLHQIEDLITATTITPVATGAIDSTNAVAKFEQMYNAAPEEVKMQPCDIFCSWNQRTNYLTNRRDTYTVDSLEASEGLTLDLSEGNCRIVPLPGLAGSNRLILAPRGILQIGMDLESDIERITIEKRLRAIDMMMDGQIGVGISATEFNGQDYLLVNDQA